MPIFIIIIMLGLLVFSISIRTRISNLLVGTGYYIAGAWNNISPAIRDILRVSITIIVVCWGTTVVLMIGLGIYANAVSSALIITILFPLWLIALIMPIGKIFRILKTDPGGGLP